MKKKLYEEEGNQVPVKQKQKKLFYKEWWVWLILLVMAITARTVLGREKQIEDKPGEPEETIEVEEEVEERTYTYEDFKGT